MNLKKIIFLVVLLLILGAASCKSGSSSAAVIGEVVVTTEINNDNTPVGNLPVILDTSPKIYASVELINVQKGDSVQVVWRYLPNDQIIATETFTGRRMSDQPHDFVGGPSPATSWLSSSIILADLNWPNGDYEIAVQLNRKETKELGFSVTNEHELDTVTKQALIKNVWLGKGINSNRQITLPTNNFSKTDKNIYAVALTKDAPINTRLKAQWKLLETGEIMNEFITSASGSEYVVFVLNLQQAGRTAWNKGNYTFSLFVDNTMVTTKNFQIM
ncbi:hypothetical protein KJ836_01560 [Patescibacteria group bacterium]|nr:hypothetical protein [Patescibacteria group bacterium]